VTVAEPRLLILETSGRVGYVALAEGSRVCAARRLDEARRHARDLAPTVADLLAGAGWRPRELSAVLISRGPGSYTGLRVGIMSAKTLAYATGCAVIAIDTFAAIAVQAPEEASALEVLSDAQQDRVYVQRFLRELPQPESEVAMMPVTEWLSRRSPDVWATGPGLRVVGERLAEQSRVVTPELWDPVPESLLRIGWRRFAAGERDDLWTLEPLYVRPSSAEEKWPKGVQG
jgi:tRNA threonylcarbamoyladenosine biosynthesis protein TsaB